MKYICLFENMMQHLSNSESGINILFFTVLYIGRWLVGETPVYACGTYPQGQRGQITSHSLCSYSRLHRRRYNYIRSKSNWQFYTICRRKIGKYKFDQLKEKFCFRKKTTHVQWVCWITMKSSSSPIKGIKLKYSECTIIECIACRSLISCCQLYHYFLISYTV